ncbi:MAG: hypothetical protein IPL49_05580 [Saprospirales bacterium]|nr:hypothetical protein [Saprospirales bacterium]
MRSFLYIWVVLFAGVLVYTGYGVSVNTTPLPTTASQGHFENHACWLPTNFPISFGLDRIGEFMGTANAPLATNHKDDHSPGFLSALQERRWQTRIAGYIAFSTAIQIGLSITKMLFPAHFFW